ncbi:MAG: hypothetical protein KC729_08345 [Candidatus Eisenbacteria bacterium]|uniref:Peptidase M1 membrane alanine aminopeptidase domain-containing protein n=1 Tax=Eiseniibacteriota bacterium TaxID=2212470 RepID=A0A956RQJ6_UNCEI|nr:hypothetical protein [Candidatus Eisenbacteria bacterium]
MNSASPGIRRILLVLGSTLLLVAPAVLAQEAGTSVRIKVGDTEPTFPPAELVGFENPQRAAIVHHLVSARVDPDRNRLEASDRLTIVHPAGIPATTPFSFLLWRDLALLEVSAVEGGDGASNDAIRLAFADRDRLQARSFWKRPPYDELGGYELARQVDLTLEGRSTWPETLAVTVQYAGTVLDSLHPPRVAYARSFDTTAGLIMKEGAFLAGSTFWIPSRPEEVYTFELRAEVPQGWRSVSQGRMATARDNGDWNFTRWICPHPMEEIYLVAGPWEEHHLRHGDVFAQTFTYADTDSSIYNRYLRGTGRYLDLYETEFGPYPFAKFALVENFWQTGFGMPSFTLLGDRVIRLPFILDTSYGHEILHNWWGNGVFVKSEEGNWCEGLTTYGADYAYKERESAAAAREYRLTALKNYLDYVSESEDVPLSGFRERHDFSTQAVGYSKSMMVFHQVRRALGTEAFQSGLQRFYHDFLWRRGSWRNLFESVAQELPRTAEQRAAWVSQQLDQWIERTGAPTIRLASADVVPASAHPKAGSGAGTAEWSVDVRVIQDVTGGEPYVLQVPVRVTGSSPDEIVEQTLDLTDAEGGMNVVCPFAPARVEVDPDFDVLRRLHREEIPASLSQVLGADSVLIVVADGQSAEMTRALQALAESWAKDQAAAVLAESDAAGHVPGTSAAEGDPAGHVPGTSVAKRTPEGASGKPFSVWFLGAGPMARAAIDRLDAVRSEKTEWSVDGGTFPATDSFVMSGPLSNEGAWGVVMPADPGVVEAIGRKVPHYGKYSYLVFEGETNVRKGVWKAGESPLARNLTVSASH